MDEIRSLYFGIAPEAIHVKSNANDHNDDDDDDDDMPYELCKQTDTVVQT